MGLKAYNGQSMYSNRSGGGSRFGGSRFGGRDSGTRTMHNAVCAECGEPCEVPFRPSGNRPIYCSKHFEGHEADSPRSDSRNFDKPRFEDRRRSSGDSEDGSRGNSQLLSELKSLNVKMDKLLRILELKDIVPATE